MELVLPSVEYKDSFTKAVEEFQADDDYTHRWLWYRKLSIPELEKDFAAFVETERGKARQENLPEGYVPMTQYWLVDNDEYVGRVSIRHKLNDRLIKIGGQIGFDIRPSKRGKGYGNKILELALAKAKQIGLNRVLVTCDERNEASRKIIEYNGGVFENQIINDEKGFEGFPALRYWIDIS